MPRASVSAPVARTGVEIGKTGAFARGTDGRAPSAAGGGSAAASAAAAASGDVSGTGVPACGADSVGVAATAGPTAFAADMRPIARPRSLYVFCSRCIYPVIVSPRSRRRLKKYRSRYLPTSSAGAPPKRSLRNFSKNVAPSGCCSAVRSVTVMPMIASRARPVIFLAM